VKIVTLACVLTLCCSAMAQERLVMPPDVLQLFKAHHCDAVDDYDNSPQAVDNAPFDYQSSRGVRHSVAWCTRESKKPANDRKYVMALYFEKSNEPLRKCPDEIPNMLQIGGLKLIEHTKISPSIFRLRFLDTGEAVERKEPFLTDGVLNRNPADGNVELFTCIDGRWARASQRGD